MRKNSFMNIVGAAVLFAVVAAGCGSAGEKAWDKDAGSSKETVQTSGDFDAENEISVVSREEGSGTRGAFIELTGLEVKKDDKKVDMTYEGAQITNNTSVMMTAVAKDDYAIGYISLGSLDDTVKAVKVEGAEPTAENIKAGSYQLSRPFNVAIKEGADNPVAADLMAFILSDEGQKIVEDNGYIPVETTGAFAGTKPSGKAVVAGSSSVSSVMEKLIEGYQALNDKAKIELLTSDSTTGMTAVKDGSCDIGMASRELKDSELAAGLVPTPIAIDGIAVIVNNHNPMSELTKEQIQAVFSGEVTTWSELQ